MTLNLHGNLPDDSLNACEPTTSSTANSQSVNRSHSVARITSTIIINVAKMRFWDTEPIHLNFDSHYDLNSAQKP